MQDSPLDTQSSLSGLKLGLETQGYLYSPQTQSEETLYSFWGKYEARTPVLGLEFHHSTEGLAVFAPGNNGFYFEAPELSIGTPADSKSPVQVQVGRKLEHWSLLDERWQLGIWQPRFLWDYLHPEEVGQTGIFVSIEEQSVRFVAFGSPLFVPERGVTISAENGQLISQSPFFISPPSQITVINRSTNVDYNLAIPPTWDIVHQYSAGWLLHFGQETGPWFQASQAWLPMNQLLLAYKGVLAVDGSTHSTTPDTADVTIVPRVTHHYLTALESGYQLGSVSVSFSSLWDVPTGDHLPDGYVSQQVAPSVALSPSLEYHFHDSDWGQIRTYVSYLYQWGGNAPDSAGDSSITSSSSTGSIFDQRYPYQRAVMLGGESGLPGARFLGAWTDHVTLSGRVLFDLGHQGTILSTDIRFQPLAHWQLNVGADLLGSNEPMIGGQNPSDFIARYEGNDDFRGGLSYAF